MKSLRKVVLQSEDIITSQRVKERSNVRISEDSQRHYGRGDGAIDRLRPKLVRCSSSNSSPARDWLGPVGFGAAAASEAQLNPYR